MSVFPMLKFTLPIFLSGPWESHIKNLLESTIQIHQNANLLSFLLYLIYLFIYLAENISQIC